MKDITRIHIAKVPYSVELSAKKQLEKYIDELEAYTSDKELLEDIEIRITELLLERGVKQEDVISEADVKAIREQLGEPKEFMSDDTTLDVDPEMLTKDAGRKYYRNLDNALLGGVLSGVASYFRINAVWVRLIFIALTFFSFGLFVLLYVVLWLIVPPARTAAEKLQMAGRPVTLNSIRELNDSGSSVDIERRAAIIKRVGTILLGLTAVGGALVSIAILTAFTIGVLMNQSSLDYALLDENRLSIVLAYAAGILLTILFLLIAIAAFAQKFNKRIWVSAVIIIFLGIGSFGTAVATAAYQERIHFEEVQRNTVDMTLKNPEDLAAAKTMSVDIPSGASLVYVVNETDFSIKQRALKDSPKAVISVVNGEMKVRLAGSEQRNVYGGATITIYGPRLDSIIVSNGYASYNSGSQATFKAEVYNNSSLRLVGSRIDTLTVKTDGSGQLSAEEAAIASVNASIFGRSSVSLGNIKSLNVTNPDVCASGDTAQLSVQNIVSASYSHNGIESGAKSLEGPCLDVTFASDTSYGDYSYRN